MSARRRRPLFPSFSATAGVIDGQMRLSGFRSADLFLADFAILRVLGMIPGAFCSGTESGE